MCVYCVPVWWDVVSFPHANRFWQKPFTIFPRWGAGHGAIFPPITTATSFVQANLGQVWGPGGNTGAFRDSPRTPAKRNPGAPLVSYGYILKRKVKIEAKKMELFVRIV